MIYYIKKKLIHFIPSKIELKLKQLKRSMLKPYEESNVYTTI